MKSRVEIVQAESPTDIGAAQELMREYISWAFTLAGDATSAPTFQGIEDELKALPGIYVPPAGRLLLAKVDGAVAGCVCLKGHDAVTSEVKRLYVRPDMRGHDLGARLIESLVEEARRAGYRRIVLDSHVSMTKAHAIYEASGFRRVAVPQEFPEHLKDLAIFMELDLHGPTDRTT